MHALAALTGATLPCGSPRLSRIATDHTAATVPSTDAPMKFALLLLTACAMFARADRDRLPLLPLHLSGKRLSKPAGPRIPKAAVGQAVLCTLAVQNACQMLSMRYSRLPDQPKYLASTAVLLAEVVKILVSVAVLALQQGVPGACNTIWQGVFVNWRDTLLVGARHL